MVAVIAWLLAMAAPIQAGGRALEQPSPRRVVRASLSRKSPFLPELFPSTIDYADIVFAQDGALLGEGSYGQARGIFGGPPFW